MWREELIIIVIVQSMNLNDMDFKIGRSYNAFPPSSLLVIFYYSLFIINLLNLKILLNRVVMVPASG